MKQLWSVIKFEFAAFANNKAFIIMTLLIALIAFVAPAAPAIIDRIDFGGITSERTIAIVDNTGMFDAQTLSQFIPPNATMFTDINTAVAAVEGGDHNYALELNHDGFALHVTSMGIGVVNLQSQVTNMFQYRHRSESLGAYGVSPERIGEILWFAPAANVITIGDAYATVDSFFENMIYSYVMAFVLYLALLIGGGHLLTTVVREKSTKTMELLVTSCQPRIMMNGKVLGVGAAIMTQVLLLAIATFASMRLTPTIFEGTEAFTVNIAPMLLAYLVVFFLLGFVMYSYIYAALASTTSRMEDAQSMSMLPQLLIMAGFFMSMFGMNSPGAAWIDIASHVPLFGPFVMFMRITLGTAAQWEIWVSIGAQLVTIVIISWMAAKIYRMGTLMYGTKPTFKNLLEAFK